MSGNPLRAALDMSCAMKPPLTGVGYATLFQAQALARLDPPFDLRLFATPGRGAGRTPPGLEHAFSKRCVLPYSRRLKHFVWERWNAPPIEWFTGDADIAHGAACHAPPPRVHLGKQRQGPCNRVSRGSRLTSQATRQSTMQKTRGEARYADLYAQSSQF